MYKTDRELPLLEYCPVILANPVASQQPLQQLQDRSAVLCVQDTRCAWCAFLLGKRIELMSEYSVNYQCGHLPGIP